MNAVEIQAAVLPPVFRVVLSCIVFALLAVALGRRALRVLGLDLAGVTLLEKGFLASGLGAGFLQYLPYSLAAAGVMTVPVVRMAVLVVALALLPDVLHVVRTARRAAIEAWARRPERLGPDVVAWAVVTLLVLSLFLARASCISALSDDDGYHLASPKRWLGAGSLVYLPTYTNTNASMGFELLYALGMATWDAIAAKSMNLAAGLAALFGVWLSSARLKNGLAGVLAISFLLIPTPLVNLSEVFSLAYVDLGACWMATACLLTWLLWVHSEKDGLLVLLALFAGFAGSFKLTSLSIGIAWAPAILLVLRRRAVAWSQCFTRIVGFGALSSLPVLPWFFRNFRLTGNPLFPMFSSIFQTRDWSPSQAAIFGKYVRLYSWGIRAGARLSEHSRIGVLLVTALAIGVVGAFAASRVRRLELKGILLFATTFALISVLLAGPIFRYWLPACLCAALALSVLLLDWKRWKRAPFLLPAVLTAVGLLLQVRRSPSGHEVSSDVRLAIGVSTLDQEYAGQAFWDTWHFLNTQTPADSKILMGAFYTAFGASSYGGFWVDRKCFTSDSHLQAYLALTDWHKFTESVKAAGITHVVMPEDVSAQGRFGFSFVAGDNEVPFLRRLVHDYGEHLFESGSVSVYRVRL